MSLNASFASHSLRVNGLSFSPTGEYLITSSEDNTLQLYDCLRGSASCGYDIQRYGCEFASFLDAQTVMHASRNVSNFDLRLLSLETSQYLGFYQGHQTRVTSLSVSSDRRGVFASTSWDGSVHLWNRNYNGPLVQIKNLDTSSSRVLCAFDPTGSVLAISDSTRFLRLYDVREMGRGPFGIFELSSTRPKDEIIQNPSSHFCPSHTETNISRAIGEKLLDPHPLERTRKRESSTPFSTYSLCSLCFSENGKYIVVGSVSDDLLLLDAFTGDTLNIIRSSLFYGDVHPNSRGLWPAFVPFPWFQGKWGQSKNDTSFVVHGETNMDNSSDWRPDETRDGAKELFCALAKGTRQGKVHFWDIHTGTTLHVLRDANAHTPNTRLTAPKNTSPGTCVVNPAHSHPLKHNTVYYVAFNPQYLQMSIAHGNGNVSLWTPS